MADTFNIMLSAAGRRVALYRALHQSLEQLGLSGSVLATDITEQNPAMQIASQSRTVPPYQDPACLDFLLDLCHQHEIGLIVPTIDPELAFYAEHHDRFAAMGCAINIPSPEAVRLSHDKQVTHDWLIKNGLPTVQQAPLEKVLADRDGWQLPLLIKPRYGSNSQGITQVHRWDQAQSRQGETDLIVQSLAPGVEYTVDVFVDRAGRCRCAVPRKRLAVRGGEVSQGMTERQPRVEQVARAVVEALPGAFGVMNIQIFHDSASDAAAVIEINPRFGGGYPLTHEAGAPMTPWLIEMARGDEPNAHDEWTDKLMMLRYDEAVFISQTETGYDDAC